MGRVCCVLGCPSGGDAPSHQIPKNPEQFNKWKSMIYSEKMQRMTDKQISKCAVCYRHFANEDYIETFRVRKLKRGVTPSLNLPNKPTMDNDKETKVVQENLKQVTPDSGTTTSVKTEILENEETTEIPEMTVALFEDLPETLEDYLLKYSQQSTLNMNSEKIILEQNNSNQINSEQINSDQINSEPIKEDRINTEVSKTNCKVSRKRARLTAEQLIFLRCKKQAEQYAKTPTIRKLLSLLTPAERSSIQTKIRKSKYFPRIYVKIYHDIAKRKALSQL